MTAKLNILVIHGYVQTASIVAGNTSRLRTELAPIAELHYADGPPLKGEEGMTNRPRPWWWLNGGAAERWEESVQWWSDHFSRNRYDGVIGLSQGAAMIGLLVSMLENPERVPAFNPGKQGKFKFAILCSGFISNHPPHRVIYDIPPDLLTLHTVDDRDMVIGAADTVALSTMFTNATLIRHSEGHSVPVRGNFPAVMRQFIENAVKGRQVVPQSCGLRRTRA